MIKVDLFKGSKRIPTLLETFNIDIEGRITGHDGEEISLEVFNENTRLEIKDVLVLVAVTYQDFKWPPIYWKHLSALKMSSDNTGPESIILGLTTPVESLEYPGFYMIPYFSNYVIAKNATLIRRDGNLVIQSSEGNLNYRTFRMKDDSGKTQNQLRHRILCYAFKPYPFNVEDLDVNHIDGIPGNDILENLEWCTRSENLEHAYDLGLREDNKPIQVRNIDEDHTYIFNSCSQAGRSLGVTQTTISNRAKSNGYKAFDGFQFRFHPCNDPWPEIENTSGNFLVEFPDGETKYCSCNEAARHAGLTRTSLLRALREGRHFGTTKNKVTRIQ